LFKECYNLLYDKEEHLFARDLKYVIKNDGKDIREANGKKIFWSRGNGWVMGGIVRVLQELPANWDGRDFYITLLKEMSARLKDLQQEDGLWRASLLDPESYPGGEVSGSGFNCYAIAWGINHGILDKETYLPVVRKAWIGLNKCVGKDGHVGWVQPIGADPKKNFNAESWEVYGSGAFLLAGSEVIKLKK
jgi:rhamnogalacturonyl hydrolase YesR